MLQPYFRSNITTNDLLKDNTLLQKTDRAILSQYGHPVSKRIYRLKIEKWRGSGWEYALYIIISNVEEDAKWFSFSIIIKIARSYDIPSIINNLFDYFLTKICSQYFASRSVLQSSDCLFLNLPNSLTGKIKSFTNFLERHWLCIS